ncbi:MAG TPA: alpha/beta fold hydrolase, partial [Flavobacterium sp.]
MQTWRGLWFPTDNKNLPLSEKRNYDPVHYEFEIKKVLVEGIEIAYIDEGNEENEVVIFIHGMGGAVPVWRKNIAVLKEDYRCIAVDLPGHGHSGKEHYP